jgi:hypothetical protein
MMRRFSEWRYGRSLRVIVADYLHFVVCRLDPKYDVRAMAVLKMDYKHVWQVADRLGIPSQLPGDEVIAWVVDGDYQRLREHWERKHGVSVLGLCDCDVCVRERRNKHLSSPLGVDSRGPR